MDDLTRLRRKDTTKGPPLRILTLDGGGVRGYSVLIILQELMHRTFVEMEGRAPKRHEIPKPCDHFDLIAGAGTGGLIAIMLGRLRLDLDTCKEVYVRMTRRVFETDKTFLGVPLKGTMFKASKLEEVIREVVGEHTVYDDEGNDALATAPPMSLGTVNPNIPEIPQRNLSQSSRYSQIGVSPVSRRISYQAYKFGNPNALLYDTRENRTKTVVTAVLKGSNVITQLRSYDSRKEPAPDVNCTIWQAGRATSATQMAFKPIQIGQSVYLDEGGGKYNPAPQILDEAVVNEWPGREVGIFVSIGTGKRPAGTAKNSHEWWEAFFGGSMSEFAEARRRLMEKIEGCEDTHKAMLREHLAARGVNPENYCRLNVEVGVGEMGMNEWNRLAEMTTNTRSYLSRKEVQNQSLDAAAKLAKIHFAKIRYDRAEARKQSGADRQRDKHEDIGENPWELPLLPPVPPPHPMAVELPGDDAFSPQQQHEHWPLMAEQKNSIELNLSHSHRPSIADLIYGDNGDGNAEAVSQLQPQWIASNSPPDSPALFPAVALLSGNDSVRVPRRSYEAPFQTPPPVPPKTPVNSTSPVVVTPLPYPDQDRTTPPHSPHHHHHHHHQYPVPHTFINMGELGMRLPYLDHADDRPPPVNMANKPSLPP